jgi:hypothetical protein
MEKKHSFKFVLKENVIRKMNRKQYKASMRWLRTARKAVEEQIAYNQIRHNFV